MKSGPIKMGLTDKTGEVTDKCWKLTDNLRRVIDTQLEMTDKTSVAEKSGDDGQKPFD